MPDDWKNRLSQLDRLIRKGKFREVRDELKAIAAKRPPREALADLANFSWRTSDPSLGLRLLGPIVRPSERKPTSATGKEKAEYAACLIKVGALNEASELLAAISPEETPVVLIYQAFVLVARWDYAASIALLTRYLSAARPSRYQKFVAQANLAAAYVEAGQTLQATSLLRKLLHDLHMSGHGLLLGRTLLLCAENFIHAKDWKRVDAFLDKAEKLLTGTDSLDHFFVRKFRAIAHFLRRPGASTLPELDEIREQAVRWKHWETLRDCDRFEAIALGREELLAHLHFGTPHEAFRDQIRARSGFTPDEAYVWKLRRGRGPTLKLATGAGGKKPLKVGQSLHRLLAGLASDFYRPLRTAELHALVFPGDFFHPVYSPQRLRTVLSRLRLWLKKSALPLAVTEEDGTYRLTADAPCSIEIPRPASAGSALLEKLRLARGVSPFSTGEAAKDLGVSDRTARRYLEEACRQGLIEALGKGRATRYAFVAAPSKSEAG